MDPVTILMGLAQFAPQLIKWTTGSEKAENVAKAALDVAQQITGCSDAQGNIDMLRADPKLAAEYADKIKDREFELNKAYLADVGSARQMQIAALGQGDNFSKRFVYVFASAWSLFSMVFFLAVTFGDVPTANVRVVDTILGFVLGTAIASIFNFFFGTTVGSQRNSEAIRELAKKA